MSECTIKCLNVHQGMLFFHGGEGKKDRRTVLDSEIDVPVCQVYRENMISTRNPHSNNTAINNLSFHATA